MASTVVPNWPTPSCRCSSCLQELLGEVAQQIAKVERSIVKSEKRDPEQVLDELYRLRHELLTVRTSASLSREAFAARRARARTTVSPGRLALIEDLIDQYERLT